MYFLIRGTKKFLTDRIHNILLSSNWCRIPYRDTLRILHISLSRNPRKKFGVQEPVLDRSRVPLRVSISEMCGNRYAGNCDGSFTSSRTGNPTGCFMDTPTKINMRKTHCLYRNLCVFSCTTLCVTNFSFKTTWNSMHVHVPKHVREHLLWNFNLELHSILPNLPPLDIWSHPGTRTCSRKRSFVITGSPTCFRTFSGPNFLCRSCDFSHTWSDTCSGTGSLQGTFTGSRMGIFNREEPLIQWSK